MAASYALNKGGYPTDDQLAELGEELYKVDSQGGEVESDGKSSAKVEKGKRTEKEEKGTPGKRQRTLSEFEKK